MMANLPRMRAVRIFEMARAIGVAVSDDNADELVAALGQSVTHAGGGTSPSGFSSWRQGRLASFKGAG